MICRVCNRARGRFELVTYLGAPDGGIPVHQRCVRRFFVALDWGWEPSSGPPIIKYGSKLPTVVSADGEKEPMSAIKQEASMADMTRFGSASYLGLDDVREGPIRGVIAAVEVNKKIDRPTLIFTNGLKFTLNKTNAQTLINIVGPDDESWCGETVELTLGQIEFKEKMVDTVVLSVIPRPANVEKIKPPKPPKKKSSSDMDDAIPFERGGEG
jgi:hypothetical protein